MSVADEVDTDAVEVGDRVAFEWTDGSEMSGEVESLWEDPTAPEGDRASAGVSVPEEGWPAGRTYDIALSWITEVGQEVDG